jgi:D-aspartate ligase
MSSSLRAPPVAVVCGDLNLLRCLAGRGIPNAVVAWDPAEPALRSRQAGGAHLIAPPSQAQAALSDLMLLARGYERRPILLYGSDELLLLISRNREQLAPHFSFRMPPAERIEELVDKTRFASLSERLGLPVPPSLAGDGKTQSDEVLDQVGLPCALKPSTHIGWLRSGASSDGKPRKALVARSRAELEWSLERVKRHASSFLVQRYIGGGEERIYSYHAYLGPGADPLGEFAGKKIRTYPMEAGVSTCLELVEQPALLELGRSICKRLELSGPVKLDFKRDPVDQRFYLFEVNPRFTLWAHLGAASGVNLPELCYADLAGERITPPGAYRTGVRWVSFGNDLRAFIRDYRPSGQLGLVDWLRSYRGDLVYDVFSWRDPLPLASSMLSYGKALAARLGERRR